MKGINMKKLLFSILLITIGISGELKNAKIGEYYEISGNALALLREPKVSTDSNVNKKNIIVDLTDEKKNIQIIDTKGFIDRYYKVNLIRDGKIKLTGWIWSKGVSSFNKISKSEAFYVKPIPKYKPTENDLKSVTKTKDTIIGKWVDNDQYVGGIYLITESMTGLSIKITYKDGSVSVRTGSFSKVSNGKKINYQNSFGEYYLLYNNGELGLCDDMGCFKSLKQIK